MYIPNDDTQICPFSPLTLSEKGGCRLIKTTLLVLLIGISITKFSI